MKNQKQLSGEVRTQFITLLCSIIFLSQTSTGGYRIYHPKSVRYNVQEFIKLAKENNMPEILHPGGVNAEGNL